MALRYKRYFRRPRATAALAMPAANWSGADSSTATSAGPRRSAGASARAMLRARRRCHDFSLACAAEPRSAASRRRAARAASESRGFSTAAHHSSAAGYAPHGKWRGAAQAGCTPRLAHLLAGSDMRRARRARLQKGSWTLQPLPARRDARLRPAHRAARRRHQCSARTRSLPRSGGRTEPLRRAQKSIGSPPRDFTHPIRGSPGAAKWG